MERCCIVCNSFQCIGQINPEELIFGLFSHLIGAVPDDIALSESREQIKSERCQALKIPVCSTSANDVKKASTSWLEIISPILRRKNGIV